MVRSYTKFLAMCTMNIADNGLGNVCARIVPSKGHNCPAVRSKHRPACCRPCFNIHSLPGENDPYTLYIEHALLVHVSNEPAAACAVYPMRLTHIVRVVKHFNASRPLTHENDCLRKIITLSISKHA